MGLLAQNDGAAFGGVLLLLVYIALIAFFIAGMWKTFDKAGQPGWTALIPILNILVWVRIAGKEWWWILLLLIPCVGFIVSAIISFATAERFGKSTGFGVGLWLLGPIFFLILGFGSAQYQHEPDPIF